jgi:hypothetical protein
MVTPSVYPTSQGYLSAYMIFVQLTATVTFEQNYPLFLTIFS